MKKCKWSLCGNKWRPPKYKHRKSIQFVAARDLAIITNIWKTHKDMKEINNLYSVKKKKTHEKLQVCSN